VRPIRKGDRGAAVEDVQRRLLILGADLGTTGVDGVFLGATFAAVSDFQRRRGLAEDGEVGPETWSALVDATFTLGDRLLYLRSPYLHGADVSSLQHALNALGFSCGDADGIFGTFTERAVRDFQGNAGLAADGIVGPDTVRAIGNLRHAWVDRPSVAPVELRTAPARAAGVLRRLSVAIVAEEGAGDLAGRVANLALASEPDACLTLELAEGATPPALTIVLRGSASAGASEIPVEGGGEALTSRMAAAIASAEGPARRVGVVLDESVADEHGLQAVAVALLDGVCLGLAALEAPVLP
jgi:hypothetical protein